MNIYDASEQAYKRGYEAGQRDAVEVDKAIKWLEGYTMTDTKHVYSNGCVYVPMFRVKQAFEDKSYNGLFER